MSNFVSRSANNISGGSETDLCRLIEFIGMYGGFSYFVKPPCHHWVGMFGWGSNVQDIALGLLQNMVSDADTLNNCFSMVSSVSPWLERWSEVFKGFLSSKSKFCSEGIFRGELWSLSCHGFRSRGSTIWLQRGSLDANGDEWKGQLHVGQCTPVLTADDVSDICL